MFIYSIPLFFTEIRWVSPMEAFIMFSGLFVLVYMTTSKVTNGRSREAGTYLFSAWTGALSLRSVFWPFFLLLNGMLYGLDSLVKAGHLTVSSWDDLHFVLLFPISWWTISLWGCSINTGLRLWAASARMVTICVVLEYALKLYIRVEYPRIFFNCEEVLLDFGSCF